MLFFGEVAARGRSIVVDLEAMEVSAEGRHWSFELEDEARMMLMQGLDAIELTKTRQTHIDAFRTADRLLRPWVYFDGDDAGEAGPGNT